MLGKWQPYPNEPQVRNLMCFLNDLQERALQTLVAGDEAATQRLLQERSTARERLDELTASLLQDASLVPRWVEHTPADAEAGAVPCLECGNNIPPGQSRCSYCGWTYQADVQP